jgi:putative IMPACT (imprinted ancient) family translation regulator
MIGYDKSVWRSNDDGEPSGTAGKPILGQINSKDLTNILIIVVRYFGGTLLGVSGLINAYRSAAADAIEKAEIAECIVREYYSLKFPYSSMNDVMRIIKDGSLVQSDQNFELECSIRTGIRLSERDLILSKFATVENLHLEYLETR